MKLEQQVAPLALAQRMKELGFPQETCFAWVSELLDNDRDVHGVFARNDMPKHGGAEVICAAPTVAEMGEWLPGGSRFTITGGGERHEIEAVTVRGAEYKNTVMYKMPTAEALARFLIALAGSGALDPRGLR